MEERTWERTWGSFLEDSRIGAKHVDLGLKYCVASIFKVGESNEYAVLFRTHNRANLSPVTESIDDEAIIWYETAQEALEHRVNYNDCVVSKDKNQEEIAMKARAMRLGIYEDKGIGNCSNNGISARYDDILLLCDDGYHTVDLDNPPENLCKIVESTIFGEKYLHVEPVAKHDSGCVGWMDGGCCVKSSDARFNQISKYPLSLHDRQETFELNDRLSR